NQIKNSVEPNRILVRTDIDLIDEIWEDRPLLRMEKAYVLSEDQTGKSIQAKIKEVQQILKNKGADFHLVSSLDDIAWTFNIRGADVKCNPVVLSFALFSKDQVQLFIDAEKLEEEDILTLTN